MTMRIFIWIVFILSLIASILTTVPFIDWLQHGWGWGAEWNWRLIIIPYSLSITGFVYLFLGKWFEKLNKNQKRILAIFIPIIIFFIAFIIASSLGVLHFHEIIKAEDSFFHFEYRTRHTYEPFNLEKTWYVWVLYLIFCCIFEYKLFEDKKMKIFKEIIFALEAVIIAAIVFLFLGVFNDLIPDIAVLYRYPWPVGYYVVFLIAAIPSIWFIIWVIGRIVQWLLDQVK